MTAADMRREREARGWTQAGLGARLGMAKASAAAVVCHLETGARPITLGMAARLREVFARVPVET